MAMSVEREKENCSMSTEARIQSLKAKHRDLDEKIATAAASPAADGSRVTAMKREKLRIKDEIARLAN